MSKYEIQVPGAKQMIEYERAERTWPKNKENSIVAEVTDEILLELFLSYHQKNVDRILAAVMSIGNNEPWMKSALEVALHQVTEGRHHKAYEEYDVKFTHRLTGESVGFY